MLEELQNMTSQGDLFSPGKVTSVGLYGASSLCYPDLFSTASQMLGYKITYMIETSVYLSVIVICYILIVKEFLKSRNAVRQAAPAPGGMGRPTEEAVTGSSSTLAPPRPLVVTSTSSETWGQRPGATRLMFPSIRA